MPFLGTQPAETALTGGQISNDVIDSQHYADGSIDTAHIADDQVTLAKMASGTDGNIISYDASGNPVAIATGTAGHFLKSQGAGSQPVFAAAGGAWTKIGTADASGSANLTITGLDNNYDAFYFHGSQLVPATDGVANGWLRFGDSSGIDSGGSDYQDGTWEFSGPSQTIQPTGGALSAQIRVNCNYNTENIGNATGEHLSFEGTIMNGTDGGRWPVLTGTYVAIGSGAPKNPYTGLFYGAREAVITLTQIQFLFASGNVTSGRFTVWGASHA